MLARISSVYLHLDTEDNRFAKSIAEDGRSYSDELFDKAHNLMTRHGIQSQANLAAFTVLREKVYLNQVLFVADFLNIFDDFVFWYTD